MTPLLLVPLLAAQEAPPPGFPRSAEGVAAAIGEVQPLLQSCVSAASQSDGAVVRLQFTVGLDGTTGAVGLPPGDEDTPLAECLAAPFAQMRFAAGEVEMPVEVPISVYVEERSQTITQR